MTKHVGALETYDNKIHHLQAQVGNINMPHNYEHNGGQVDTQVPTNNGWNIVTQWVCFLGNGKVLARAGEHPDEPDVKAIVSLSNMCIKD